MDLRPVINRGITYILTVSLVSAAIITIGRISVPAWTTEALIVRPEIVVITLVTFIILSTPARSLFGRVIDRYLYRGRLEYPSALRAD